MKPLLRELVPPLLRRWSHRGGWAGDFPSWTEAAARCPGYGQAAILDRVEQAAHLVRAGAGAFDRDSVVFAEPEYSWPLLAPILQAAARDRGRLRVLDFGGALGSTYIQHRRWLDDLPEVSWNVVEQEHFVRCGREYFEDARLRFHRSIPEAIAAGAPGAAILSSVLGYLPDPETVLDEIAATGAAWLLIDRTGFTHEDRERITIETVPPEIYPASYPCRFFSRTALIGRLAPRYELVATTPALDRPPPFAEFLGLFFRRR